MFDVAREEYYCISKGRTFPPDIGEMWQILVAMIGSSGRIILGLSQHTKYSVSFLSYSQSPC